ncbi:MAG: rRNA adenine N(6)-methyltransferase family protein [Jiangellaceae bacterium]|nr:rRNA adenine N(6)-methyltransferase family protein [Jiangellaceae bacterium]
MSGQRRSRRTWGWHRLTDEWAARIVADAEVRPGELVLDIGAGDGAITAQLLEHGARVLAVELHPRRAAELRWRFAGTATTVIQQDAADLRLPRRPFRVVANPPFRVSSAIMRRLLAPGSRLVAADLVLQRAVVAKYADGLAPAAVRWLRTWDVRRGRALPRRAFVPPPGVDCAVLVVRRRP